MTITSTTTRDDYTGTGAVKTYSYNFKIFSDTDLVVTVVDLSGAETTLTITTDYTVADVGETAGGSITLVDASQAWLTGGNLTTGWGLTLQRVRPITQTTDIRNQGDFFPEAHENEFDKQIMVDQQQGELIDRSLKLPTTETPSAAATAWPDATDRASNFLGFDASGNPIASVGSVTGIAVTAYMETLLDDANASTARATLDAPSNAEMTAAEADIVTNTDDIADNAAILAGMLAYRRPNLVYSSATTVDIENNTGAADQTRIVFPDGDVRDVTEDLSSTNVYRRFDITATASLVATHESGMLSGESESANSWYCIYAVKTTDDADKFVLVGTQTQPKQADFATLNSNFGTNGWVYIGLIRNGDNSGATGDILNFYQSGPNVLFANICVATATGHVGIRLFATAAGSTNNIDWSYSAGMGTTQVPSHIKTIMVLGGASAGSGSTAFTSRNGQVAWGTGHGGVQYGGKAWIPAVHGTHIQSGTTSAFDLALEGWIDPILSGGINPVL